MTLFFSDDHWSSNDKYDLNSLKDSCLRRLLQTYGKRADRIFHLGDQTDRRHFDAVLMAQMSRVYLESLVGEISKLVVVCGNHDSSDRLITPFSTFANGTWANGKGISIVGRDGDSFGDFYCRGWLSNETLSQTDAKYLLTHARVKEWAGTGEKAFTLDELNALSFERIILGDTHQQVESGKVLSCGCLFPSSFKDEGIEAGAVWFDEDHNTFERIKIPNYPIFRKLVVTPETVEPEENWVKGNIVRVEFKGPQKWITNDLKRRWQLAIWAREPRSFEFGEDFYIAETSWAVIPANLTVEQRYEEIANSLGWEDEVAEIGRKALV